MLSEVTKRKIGETREDGWRFRGYVKRSNLQVLPAAINLRKGCKLC